MDEKILRGIKACYHEINGKNEFAVLPGTVIYLLSGRKHRFVVENNPQILGEKTTNPEATIADAKWAFILSWLWNEAEKTKPGEDLPLWADLGGGKKNINELGIGQQYKAGKSIEITPDQNDVWLGNFHRMEVFNTHPNNGLFFTFATIDKPKIYLAYFDKQNIKSEVKDFTIDDGYYSYGEVIKFYVATHMLPMKIGEQYSEKYGKIDTETSFENLEFEIKLTDENHNSLLDEPILKGKLVDYSPIVKDAEGSTRISTGTANIQYEFPILINSKWKDDIHTKDEKTKTYSVTIKITNTKTKKEYFYTPDLSSIRRIADSKRDFDDIEVSSVFMVKYESMDTILSQMEEKKNNMIQYIGDIDYNYKETNPCAYSKIVINNGEKDFEIFNEYKLSGKEIKDKTNDFIDIICGDKETKDIKITAKFLQSKDAKEESVRTNKNGFKCQMILNDGKPHNGTRDVFKMDWIIGQYKPSTDPKYFLERLLGSNSTSAFPIMYNPSNKDKAPKLSASKIPTDQEMKGTPLPESTVEAYKSLTVAGVQGLVEDTDFTISEANDSITLKLKFNYNKTIAEGFSSGIPQESLNTLWLFRYFWLLEDNVQTYFVPVTTCRYPNQVAKIKVHPDISWTFHVNYGMKNPLYYRDTWVEMRPHRIEDAVVKAQVSDVDGYDGTVETTFGLSIEAKWNGSEEAKLDQKISEKVKLIIGSFIKIKQFVDAVTGKDRGNSTEGISAGLMERVRRTPLTIEVLSPQISIGAGWEYKFGRIENGEDNILAPTLGLVAKAEPAIGAEAVIDLIAWGKKLHPAAEAVITALDLLAYASNAEVRFDLKFYGKLVIEGNIELSRLKKEGELKAEGQFGFSLTLAAKATGKLETWWNEVDYNFEARAEGKGYFSLGLSAGLDDYKGLYLQPIVRHSGIKITLVFKAEIGSINRGSIRTYPIIKEDKLNLDKKYYIND